MSGGEWTPTSAPGAAENYWTQNGSQFTDPGAAQNYWQGVQGFFGSTPNSSETAIGQGATQLGGAGDAERMYAQYYGSGALTNPGQAEAWYAANGGAMNQPGAGGNALRNLLPQYSAPTAGESYNAATQGGYLGTGALESLYQQYGNTMQGQGTAGIPFAQAQYGYGNALAGEDQFANTKAQYGTTGTLENAFNQNGSNMLGAGQGGGILSGLSPQYNNLTASETRNTQDQPYYNTQGQAENFYDQRGQELAGPGQLAQMAGGIAGNINGATNLQSYYGSQLPALANNGYTESYANQTGPQSSSYAEDYLTGGGAGTSLDALYSRLRDVDSRALDNRAAAGGSFNSGAALRAIQESNSDLDAQHVRDYASAVNSADAAKTARLSGNLSLAQGADQSMNNRIGLGLQGATGVDQGALARGSALQSLGTGLSQEQLANFQASQGAAQAAQAAGLARTQAGQSAADSSTNALMQRMSGQANVANLINQNDVNRYSTYMNTAGQSQAAGLARLTAGQQAANSAGDEAAARLAGMTNLGSAMGANDVNRYSALFGAAGQSQSAALARLLGGQSAADSASQDKLARLSGASNTAGMIGADDLSRFNASSNAAQSAQAAAMNRIATGMGAAGTSESAMVNRTQTAAQLNQMQEQLALQRMLAGGQLSTSAGNEKLAGLTAGMNASNLAENSQENRQNNVVNNLTTVANGQAGAYTTGTAAANNEQLQLVMSQIQGLLGKGALSSQEQLQLNDLISQYTKLGATALTTKK